MRFAGPALLFAGLAAGRSVVPLEGSGCLRFLGLAFLLAGRKNGHVSLWVSKYNSGSDLMLIDEECAPSKD